MDSLVKPDGTRLLPLLRIARALGWPPKEQAGRIQFTAEGVGLVELDLSKEQVRINGQTRPIKFQQAVSEITAKPDIYVSERDLSEMLDVQLIWDIALYEYRIQLDRELGIWKRQQTSLSSNIKFLEMDLPELLPEANRSREALQLVEVAWQPSYRWRQGKGETPDSHEIEVGAPRETLWGNVANGQYRVQISHPSPLWSNDGRGWRWRNEESYGARADWFEWVHRQSASEIVLGDSSSGLSDLVFPVLYSTGVRANGLAGWAPGELELDQSQLGLRRYFGRPLVFEGSASLDATVDLVLNGRTVETQKAFPEADSAPGMGVYRFKDIELSSGILNEVAIVIKEADGQEIRIEKSMMGTPQLLPKGRTAYLGLAGSRRVPRTSNLEAVDFGDFYGYVAGGRVLYGLTDRLTVGTALASQADQYHRYLEYQPSTSTRRSFPTTSEHAGATFSYLPLDNMMLSGDLAGSQARDSESRVDTAARLRAEYLPTKRFALNVDLADLEPDFFDGLNPDASDRRGGEVGLTWRRSRKWSLRSALGQAYNNLDGQLDETLEVGYQNVGVETSILPRSTLSAVLHHLSVNTEPDSSLLAEFRLGTAISGKTNLYGLFSVGDELYIEDDSSFLSPLRFRNAPWALRPSQYWALSTSLNTNNTIALAYRDFGSRQALSLVHSLNLRGKSHPMHFRTELSRRLNAEADGGDYEFRCQGEYLLDRVGYNRLGFSAEYYDGVFGFYLSMSMRSLFAQHNGRFKNINESRVRPSYGAVHGKVFVDYNGNHLLDPNEPGVRDVKVSLGERWSALTDERGYYILSAPPGTSEVRVYLDIATVPALYNASHGTQLAKVYKDSLTEVNLSVAPLIALTGRAMMIDPNTTRHHASDPNSAVLGAAVVAAPDANDMRNGSSTPQPVAGVRVSLSNPQSGLLVADSVTGGDGGYYLGDVKPGRYVLRPDPKTLPKQYEIAEQERTVEVKPTKEEFLEIEIPDFVATIRDPNATEAQDSKSDASAPAEPNVPPTSGAKAGPMTAPNTPAVSNANALLSADSDAPPAGDANAPAAVDPHAPLPGDPNGPPATDPNVPAAAERRERVESLGGLGALRREVGQRVEAPGAQGEGVESASGGNTPRGAGASARGVEGAPPSKRGPETLATRGRDARDTSDTPAAAGARAYDISNAIETRGQDARDTTSRATVRSSTAAPWLSLAILSACGLAGIMGSVLLGRACAPESSSRGRVRSAWSGLRWSCRQRKGWPSGP